VFVTASAQEVSAMSRDGLSGRVRDNVQQPRAPVLAMDSCRIAHRYSENSPISYLRFVPPLAAVCSSLLRSKGKKRATFIASNARLSENMAANRWAFPSIRSWTFWVTESA
jgi:hypothetical protein